MRASIESSPGVVRRDSILPLTIFSHDPSGKWGRFIALDHSPGEYLAIDGTGKTVQTRAEANCYILGKLHIEL